MARDAQGNAKYLNTDIIYTLKRSSRRTIGIIVNPDKTVVVRAPFFAGREKIREMVELKGRWILKKQQDFEGRNRVPSGYSFESGELFFYLGKTYPLSIEEGQRLSVGICSDTLKAVLPGKPSPERIKGALLSWYRKEARRIISERLSLCADAAKKIGITAGKDFSLRRMKRRWGSCSSKGEIQFTPFLIGTSEICIDYVIIHELCHRKEPNHGQNFYRLLEKALPDWRERKKELMSRIVPYF